MTTSAPGEERRLGLAKVFGDPTAFRAWYDDAVGRVYGYLYGRSGGDTEVAEEITQQTFMQAIRHWQAFDGRSDSVTWLCSIARNKLTDHYRERDRQRRRHLQLVVREIKAEHPSPDREVGDRDAVVSALRQLPDIERTALVLRYVDDLSVREVASLLGRSIDGTDALSDAPRSGSAPSTRRRSMSDDVLRRKLRVVDSAMRPNPVFVDDLHAQLAAELGFEALPRPAEKVRAPARPQFRRRGRLGWLAVAALLVLALLALLLGQAGQTPDESPPPPSGSPSSEPSAAPSSEPSGAPSPAASFAPIADSSPAPDNLRSDGFIAYESDAMSGLSRLRLMRPDLSSVELLPEVADAQFGAAWHPDGERLAYTGFDPAVLRSPLRIWETDAQGAQPILLSEGCDLPACVAEYEPSYSPDGSQLVFVRTRLPEGGEEESVVAIRDLETGAVTELDATSRPRRAAENLHPRWSPDSQTIAYGVTDYGEFGFPGDSRIHLVSADGSDERIISAPELHAGEPEWSQDGETILFASNPYRPVLRAVGSELDAPHRLGLMSADGSNARLFDFGRVTVAGSWAANREQILFTLMEGGGTGIQRPSNPRLFVMDPDGGNVLPLSSNPGDALYGVQQPVP